MAASVLDASALLALLRLEPGAATVRQAINDGASISAVNLAEVVARLSDSGQPDHAIRETIQKVDLDVIEFDAELAYAAGGLRRATRSLGLSLGDRACLALARRLNRPALTADRAWSQLELEVAIQVVR